MKLEWRDILIGKTVINTSLTVAETAELQRLAAGKAVLEVGSAFGYSTVALGLVAESVIAVDPHTGHNSLAALIQNVEANGLTGKVRWIAGRSQDILPTLIAAFDMVWIDGDHSAETVEHDVTWALRLLRPGGVLACHDYDEATCPGVKIALDKLFGGPGVLTDTLAVYQQ
jgi:predicted O-methyltransferase YrrM